MAKATNVIDFAAYKKRANLPQGRPEESGKFAGLTQPHAEKETDHMEQAIARIMSVIPNFTREQAIRQIEHATRMLQARMECNDE